MLSSIYCAVTTATSVDLEDVSFIDAAGNQIPFSSGAKTGTLTISSTGATRLETIWESETSEDFTNYVGLYGITTIKARSTGLVRFYVGQRMDQTGTNSFQVLSGETFLLGPPKESRIVLQKVVPAGNPTNAALSDPAIGAIDLGDGTDSTVLTVQPRALFVGTGGNLRVTMADGTDIIFYNVADGCILPIQPYIVWETNTTADNIIGLY